MTVKKIGNWKGAAELIDNLEHECKLAVSTSLKRFSLKAEAIAVKHLRDQDLDWSPLNPAYLRQKIKKGLSPKILIRTSSYMQSITSWVDKDTALIGVKKISRDKDGKALWNIAKLHEYGSEGGRIKARPLWKPTLKEAVKWHKKKNMPDKIFLKNIKKYNR